MESNTNPEKKVSENNSIRLNLLILFGSIIVILAAEFLLYVLNIPSGRYKYNASLPFVIENRQRGFDWRGYHTFRDELFRADEMNLTDPDLSVFWVPKPDFPPFNRDGAIGDPKDSECRKERCVRILSLGDSNTLWDGQTSYPLVLKKLIEEDSELDCSPLLLNAGVHGYSSYQGKNYMKRFIVFNPDIVTISFGWNDTVPVRAPEDKYYGRALKNFAERREYAVIRVMRNSRIFQLLEMGILSLITQFVQPKTRHRVTPEDFEMNLEEMIALSQGIGAVPVIISRPHYFRKEKIHIFEKDVDAYNEIARNIADKNNLLFFDMNGFSKGFRFEEIFSDYSHFNEKGHYLAAEALYKKLRDKIAEICSKKRP